MTYPIRVRDGFITEGPDSAEHTKRPSKQAPHTPLKCPPTGAAFQSAGVHLVPEPPRCPNCVNGGVWVGGQERYIPCNACGGTGRLRNVPEPPAILLVIDELTFRSYAHNRRISPEISPERWAAIFGKEQVEAMENQFQGQVEPPAIPEEPEWGDSDTARQMYDNITGRS